MKWISVKTELPRYGQEVLLTGWHPNSPGSYPVYLGKRIRTDAQGEWWHCDVAGEVKKDIFFWMQLPPKPDSFEVK